MNRIHLILLLNPFVHVILLNCLGRDGFGCIHLYDNLLPLLLICGLFKYVIILLAKQLCGCAESMIRHKDFGQHTAAGLLRFDRCNRVSAHGTIARPSEGSVRLNDLLGVPRELTQPHVADWGLLHLCVISHAVVDPEVWVRRLLESLEFTLRSQCLNIRDCACFQFVVLILDS